MVAPHMKPGIRPYARCHATLNKVAQDATQKKTIIGCAEYKEFANTVLTGTCVVT